jgi:hypothetical protein
MKHIKAYEDYTLVEYVAPEGEHTSYKNEIKKKKRKKRGEMGTIIVPPNHTKDVISFKRTG